MKKLILFLLLIPNLVMAETWVCSYLHQGEIETQEYKRVNDEFHLEYSNGDIKVYEIRYENNYEIQLIQKDKTPIGFFVAMLTKKSPPIFSTTHVYDKHADNWNGECRVVE